MTLLGRALGLSNSLENPTLPLTSSRILEFLDGKAPTAGVRVTPEKSLGLPAVFRAINVVAGVSASLPLDAFTKGDETRTPIESGPVAQLIADPHPDLTPYEFWEIVYTHIGLWGDAFLKIMRDGLGRPRHLWPIHPARVKPGRTHDEGIKVYLVDGRTEYTDWEILHIPGFGYDGISGVAPVAAARQGLSLALASEEFGARLFGNGTLATGILTTEKKLDPKDADRILDRWKKKRAGLVNAHDVIVLDSGAKFEKLSIPPDDAQFLQTRQFQITEVARMFGVPPYLMYETEKSTSWGTGLEQQAIGWVKYDLRRWYTRVEQRLTKLLGGGTTQIRYNVEGLLRGDSKARGEFYKTMWSIGALSTNEIRALEDQPPVDGGDARYRPLNMGELGEYDNETSEGGDPFPFPSAPDEEKSDAPNQRRTPVPAG